MGAWLRSALVVSAASAVVLAVVSPAAAIVYGAPDQGRHPAVGSLVYDFDGDGALDQACSGTLISQTVFLTASHCTAFLDAQGVGEGEAVVTFDDEIGPGMTLHRGTAHTHPDYGYSGAGGRSEPHDIAVIVLDEPVGIQPAQLPEAGLLDGLKAAHQLRSTEFTTVGYGAVRETRKGGPAGILDNTERRFAVQTPASLTSTWLTLSANQATGDGGTCSGDSGGPHFLGAGATETNVVTSITVTGDTFCKAIDVTYRVDTPAARDFLAGFVNLP
ncbi:trypsin-like serine protease [Nocardioides sp. NPDC059952]|uniref:trypsin-like serine protease n=1 Tax=Nocardioides sp. NPDC059952 TaxID=3347014 RepID=UPI003649C8FF